MESTIDERLTRLEQEFDALKSRVLELRSVKKDWRSTVGGMPDDELSRNVERLGREWREQANKEAH